MSDDYYETTSYLFQPDRNGLIEASDVVDMFNFYEKLRSDENVRNISFREIKEGVFIDWEVKK